MLSTDESDKNTDETMEKSITHLPLQELDNSEGLYFSAHDLIEYQWPPDRSGEFYLLRHQVCQFLEIESLEEEYPGTLN